MADVAVRCADLTKRFGATIAVDGVNLSLERGRILALLGPSGCGKTSTLRLLAGFEVPDSGTVDIGGRRVTGDGHFVPPEKRRIGIVFQDYALFPHLDVAGNVGYGLAARGGAGSDKGRERRRHIEDMLALVGLSGFERRMPHALSGGEQQRVALARALVPGPEVVLLDEPFSNLDAALRGRLRAEVRRILKAAEATAVFVTHDQEEAMSLADEVAVMFRGRIVQTGLPEELYRHPIDKEVATFVGDANFLPGQASDGRVECELGVLPSRSRWQGPIEAMVRPEDVLLVPDAESEAEVVRREYFGHDQVVTVRVRSGAEIRARLGPHATFSPGDRVQVAVRSEVMTFARQ